jgi:Dolichyl-phosphate-mannose-protein mannosyltransferase
MNNLLKPPLYLSVFLFFWILFVLSNNGLDLSEGGYHYLTAEQIVNHGQLGFDRLPVPDGVFSIAPNGKFYLSHEIGNVLFLLPTALLNRFIKSDLTGLLGDRHAGFLSSFVVSFQAGIYCAITATIFFATLRTKFSLRIAPSFWATVCLVTTTFFWTYSRSLYDGVFCTTLLTLSFFLLVNYGVNHKILYLIGCYLALGLGLITRLSMVIAIVASFLYLWKTSRSFKEIIARTCTGLLVLLPFVVWQGWYNHLRTGLFYLSPVQTSQYATNNALDGNLLIGLTGLLFSPGKSIVVYAPLLILSLLLFKKFYRRYPNEALYILVLSTLWFLLHARLRSWYGAWGWGPRHFITILPLLFLPFAVYIPYIWKKKSLRRLAIPLGSFGFALAIASLISDYHLRIEYSIQNKTFDDTQFVWGFWNNQAIDMLKGAWMNLVRIATHAPIPKLAKDYTMIEQSSNTINIWINVLYGSQPVKAFLCLSILISLMGLAGWNILQIRAVQEKNQYKTEHEVVHATHIKENQ